MVEGGIFASDEHPELLEGQIVTKMTTNAPHAVCTRLVSRWLDSVLPHGYDLRVQSPIALGDRSQPEPDIAVVLGSPRDFSADHPGVKDVVLLVEVADATIRDDLNYKTGLYARANIPELWVIDINRRLAHVHRDPKDGLYRQVSILRPEERLGCPFDPSQTSRVDELLP